MNGPRYKTTCAFVGCKAATRSPMQDGWAFWERGDNNGEWVSHYYCPAHAIAIELELTKPAIPAIRRLMPAAQKGGRK